MKKDTYIQVRCSNNFKKQVVQAASYKGVSQTDFVLSALEKEVEKYNITFNKLPVGGKLTQNEIKEIDKIKGLTKMDSKDSQTTWFNAKAEIALQINEENKIIKGYLTNKKSF